MRIPFLTGTTAEEASATLRAAGLTGALEIVGLTPEQCWLDGPQGRVTETYPRHGLVVPPDVEIKVYVNPGPTTPLSPGEQSLLERVEANDRRELGAQESIFRERPSPTPNLDARLSVRASVTLDAALLDRFEDRLRSAGATVAGALAPGLTDEQIDDLALPAGIDLPEEARVWWRWHDGTRSDALPGARVLGDRGLFSLDDAVELYEIERAAVVELYGLDGLLVPVGDRPHVYFDCSGPLDEPVTIFSQNDIDTPVALLGSIGDLVTGWHSLLDAEAWTVRSDGTISVRPDRVPAHLTPIA